MADFSAQEQAIESGALVLPRPDLGTLIVTGSERQSWLSGMLTADIAPLRAGQGAYALAVNKTGRIQAEVWVALDADRALLGLKKELLEPLREHLDQYLIMEDAEVVPSENTLCWWLAHGPASESVVRVAREQGAVASLTRLGELDTAIVIAPQDPRFSEALLTAPGAVLATPEGWERVRIARMLPRFGVDFDAGNFPQEATLEHLAVSFHKGCYLGQEAVFMLEKRGHVNKRLVRLAFDGVVPDVAKDSEVRTLDGDVIGAVTSATRVGDRTMAIAMVRYKHTQSGTKLEVAGERAEVSCLATREGEACS